MAYGKQSLDRRLGELEKRAKRRVKTKGRFLIWYANPLDGSDPEPKPEVQPGDLLFEVWYSNPPVYPPGHLLAVAQ